MRESGKLEADREEGEDRDRKDRKEKEKGKGVSTPPPPTTSASHNITTYPPFIIAIIAKQSRLSDIFTRRDLKAKRHHSSFPKFFTNQRLKSNAVWLETKRIQVHPDEPQLGCEARRLSAEHESNQSSVPPQFVTLNHPSTRINEH